MNRLSVILFILFLIPATVIKSQTIDILIHSTEGLPPGFGVTPLPSLLESAYSTAGFTTVNIDYEQIDANLNTTNYDLLLVYDWYIWDGVLGDFVTDYTSEAQRLLVEQFILDGGHVIWYGESQPITPFGVVLAPNNNAFTTINSIYGIQLSHGPYFDNVSPTNIPRIHDNSGPGSLSGEAEIIASGTYSTQLDVPVCNKVYASYITDSINTFEPCIHTVVSLFPADLFGLNTGTVILSTEVGAPFGEADWPDSPSTYTTEFDIDVAEMHFALMNDNPVESECTACDVEQVEFTASITDICAGECIDFMDLTVADNISSWSWSFEGADTPVSDQQHPENICYSAPGTYEVSLEIMANGNQYETTQMAYITVNVCPPPMANFIIPDSICVGSCIDIMDASINGPESWSWVMVGASVSTSTDQNPTDICFDSVGEYVIDLTVSNANGTDSISQTIEIIPMPYSFQEEDVVCENELEINLFNFIPSNAPSNGVWSISSSGELVEAGLMQLNEMSDPEVFVYTLSNNYCSINSSLTLAQIALPEVGLGPDVIACQDKTLFLSVPNINGETYLWTTGEEENNIALSLDQFPVGSENDITIVVSNSCGSDQDAMVISIADCSLHVYVPNAFTPNDDDLNNIFSPVITGEGSIDEYTLTINDRWGGIVFDSDDPSKGWNGSTNGNDFYVPNGIYVYTLKFNWQSAGSIMNNQYYRGFVSIIR